MGLNGDFGAYLNVEVDGTFAMDCGCPADVVAMAGADGSMADGSRESAVPKDCLSRFHVRKGARNLITDVPGVRVGHVNVRGESDGGGLHTGVTAVLPCSVTASDQSGNVGDCAMAGASGPSVDAAEARLGDSDDGGVRLPFDWALPAAAYVSNGFGKSMGLVQVNELGNLETPILLTNTLSCGTCFESLVRWSLEHHPDIGVGTGTVNPVVLECNDGPINDIRALGVSVEDGLQAIANAAAGDGDFAEGAVGAGLGMTCFGLKGGIGSSSRVMNVDGRDFTIGVLVMTNFGSLRRLRIAGKPIGAQLARWRAAHEACGRSDASQAEARRTRAVSPQPCDDRDKGSIVTVIATDLPLDSRQLGRLAKRVTVGIARCGGTIGNGSGEIVVAFSTAGRMDHWAGERRGESFGHPMIDTVERLSDNAMDDCFAAVAAASEEAIISSLVHAKTVIGRTGRPTLSLRDAMRQAGVRLPEIFPDAAPTDQPAMR